MITKRLSWAVAAIALGLGIVFLFPSKSGVGVAGIRLELPARVGDWDGVDVEVTPREREALAKDTEFSRKVYRNTFGDEIYVSIVLSGQDMSTSIHRPERCLPAQGLNVMNSARVSVPLATTRPLELTRLTNTGEAMMTPVDKSLPPKRVSYRNLYYYWFVGSRDVTADHLKRTYFDIRDRILFGQNQRWAYVTVAANVSDSFNKYGRSEAATAKMVEDFIPRLWPYFQAVEPSPGKS